MRNRDQTDEFTEGHRGGRCGEDCTVFLCATSVCDSDSQTFATCAKLERKQKTQVRRECAPFCLPLTLLLQLRHPIKVANGDDRCAHRKLSSCGTMHAQSLNIGWACHQTVHGRQPSRLVSSAAMEFHGLTQSNPNYQPQVRTLFP